MAPKAPTMDVFLCSRGTAKTHSNAMGTAATPLQRGGKGIPRKNDSVHPLQDR